MHLDQRQRPWAAPSAKERVIVAAKSEMSRVHGIVWQQLKFTCGYGDLCIIKQ